MSTWRAGGPGAGAQYFVVWAWAAARGNYPAGIGSFTPLKRKMFGTRTSRAGPVSRTWPAP